MKHICCVSLRPKSDHVSGVERSYFLQTERAFLKIPLRSACSIRSAPLAQPKMPLGNFLVQESLEQAKQLFV